MKKIIYSFLIVLSVSIANAQDYIFTHFNDPYVEFNDGTLMDFIEICYYDDLPPNAQIGFQMPFYNYFLDSIGVDQAYLLSGNISDIPGEIVLAQFVPYGAIYDLNSPFTGSIRYKTDGSTGNRIFKMQYRELRIQNDSIGNDRCNFQVWMYEESGRIEYRTGPFQISQDDGYFSFENGTTHGFAIYDNVNNVILNSIFLQNSPSNPEAYFDSNEDFVPTVIGHPTNGKVYRFDRPTNTINQLNKQNKFSIFPNPAKDQIHVKGDFDGFITLELYNSLGQQVAILKTTDIELKGLSSGVYYLKVKDASSNEIIKLIME